jgi:hypothetical protein
MTRSAFAVMVLVTRIADGQAVSGMRSGRVLQRLARVPEDTAGVVVRLTVASPTIEMTPTLSVTAGTAVARGTDRMPAPSVTRVFARVRRPPFDRSVSAPVRVVRTSAERACVLARGATRTRSMTIHNRPIPQAWRRGGHRRRLQVP